MDPIDIIKKDHRTVEALFKEYEGLGEKAYAHKRQVVDQIIKELTVHAEMEESLAYPRFKEIFNKEDDQMVEEAYVEHEGAKNLLADLVALEPENPEFDARVKVLMEQITHHVKEEEGELLPKAKQEVPEDVLAKMGEEMLAFKESQAA